MSSYAIEYPVAAQAPASERAQFIRRTYLHLSGAILAFIGLEAVIFSLIGSDRASHESLFRAIMSPMIQLVILGAFIGVGALARYWAYAGASPAMQYLGLGLYVVAEAVIFVPILMIAVYYSGDPNLVPKAGILTLCVFCGLTVAAFTTRKDFSFLGPIISVAGFLMLGIVLVAMFFPGFSLGLWFSFLGVGLAAAYILYDTSNIIHHHATNMYVAAALELFASVAYLFYHILRIMILVSGDRR